MCVPYTCRYGNGDHKFDFEEECHFSIKSTLVSSSLADIESGLIKDELEAEKYSIASLCKDHTTFLIIVME